MVRAFQRCTAAALLLAPALLAGPATAQTTTAPSAAPSGAQSQAPLMTAPRPEDTPTTDPTTSPPGVSGSAPSDEMRNAAPLVANAPRDLTTAEARSLVGRQVKTRDGKTWGAIHDFTITGSDDRVDRAVLASIGETDSGAKLVTVPVDSLRRSDVDAPVTLDLSPEDLAKAPAFTYPTGEKTLVGQP